MKKIILIKSRLLENNDKPGIILDIEKFDISLLSTNTNWRKV